MQTNYYGPFLLTYLLLDKLKKSSSGRIINVSSSMARIGFINFNNIDNYPKLPKILAEIILYSKTKFANVLFTIALNKKLNGTNVTINALNPGIVNTNIYRNYTYVIERLNYYFVKYFCKVMRLIFLLKIYNVLFYFLNCVLL